MSAIDRHLLKDKHETGFPWYVAAEVDKIRDCWEAQLAGQAKELEEAKTERDNWMQVSNRGHQKLVVSQQQVTALREALEKIIKGKLARDCMCNGLPSHVWHDLEYCRTIAKGALATPSPAPESGETTCLNCGNPESHHVGDICPPPTIEWECCEVCNRMYRSGEACIDCPGFAEPTNTYLHKEEIPTNEPPETGHDSQCERVPQPEDNFERLAICQCAERIGETGTVCPCATDDVKNWCGRCSANFQVVKGYCRPMCQHCNGYGRIQQKGTTP